MKLNCNWHRRELNTVWDSTQLFHDEGRRSGLRSARKQLSTQTSTDRSTTTDGFVRNADRCKEQNRFVLHVHIVCHITFECCGGVFVEFKSCGAANTSVKRMRIIETLWRANRYMVCHAFCSTAQIATDFDKHAGDAMMVQ